MLDSLDVRKSQNHPLSPNSSTVLTLGVAEHEEEKEQAEPWRGQAWELPRRSRGRAKGIGSQGWAGWMTSDAAAARERPEGTWARRLPDVGKGG